MSYDSYNDPIALSWIVFATNVMYRWKRDTWFKIFRKIEAFFVLSFFNFKYITRGQINLPFIQKCDDENINKFQKGSFNDSLRRNFPWAMSNNRRTVVNSWARIYNSAGVEPISKSTQQIVLVKRESNDSQKNKDGNKSKDNNITNTIIYSSSLQECMWVRGWLLVSSARWLMLVAGMVEVVERQLYDRGK